MVELQKVGLVEELLEEHQAWWDEFYSRSWVDLGGPSGAWADLERFYASMLYLMRGRWAGPQWVIRQALSC